LTLQDGALNAIFLMLRRSRIGSTPTANRRQTILWIQRPRAGAWPPASKSYIVFETCGTSDRKGLRDHQRRGTVSIAIVREAQLLVVHMSVAVTVQGAPRGGKEYLTVTVWEEGTTA
jgi:hypothetical protein